MRRIVVTGMGAVSPLGCGVEAVWSRLIAGRNGGAIRASLGGWRGALLQSAQPW